MNTKEILQGIKDWAAPKVIYDISAAHNNTKYTDLSDALGTNGGNIPQEYRKGGMSIKFVQSSDHKYVQYRLTSDTFNTTVANWQGVSDEINAASKNIASSEGVNSAVKMGEMTEIICEQLGIPYNYKQKLDRNTTISNNGLIGYAADRSSFAVKFYAGATRITDIKVDGVSKGILAIGWFSQEPNLLDVSGFIRMDMNPTYPLTIPATAKWAVISMNNTDLGEVINVLQSPYKAAIPKSFEDISKRLSVYVFPTWRDERRLAFNNETKTVSIVGTKTTPTSDHHILSFSYKGVKYWIDDNISSKVLNINNANSSLALPVSSSDVAYTLDDLVVFLDNAEHDGYVKIALFTYGMLVASDIVEVWGEGTIGFDNGADNVDDIISSGIYRVESSGEYYILMVYSYSQSIYQMSFSNKFGIKLRFKASSTSDWTGWQNIDMWIFANTQKIYASILDGKDYNNYVIEHSNISADGIISTFFKVPITADRETVFYKLGDIGVPSTISGCSILAYVWYSGFPDYVMGSNCISRTTTNVPPSNARYGALILSGHTNIVITSNESIDTLKAKINILGSAINNSVGENSFANGVRSNLKILGYGNSFMRNSVAYLSAIAKGCGVNLVVGNLYTGGTELQDHYVALVNNSAVYEWHKYVEGVETEREGHKTPLDGLLEERWDAIIVHQYIPWQYPFEPTLNKFLKLIIEKIGYTPKIYINSTWAGSLDGNETYYGYETEAEMWEAMLTYVKGACADAGVQEFSIIPTGTAIQNARTLSWADDYNRFVNASPDLHHLNPAGGFIAACTLYQKIVALLNGVSCNQTTFRITTPTAMPPDTNVQAGIVVTDDNYAALCKCAIDAVNRPYIVTQQ